MVQKKALELTEIDYSPYGILYNLSGTGRGTDNTNRSQGKDFMDVDTAISLLDTLGRLGRTQTKQCPFFAQEMEKHAHTQEAQIPTDQPLVFCVALPSDTPPEADDIVPVVLRPGYVFVLHRNVWHSPSHDLLRDGAYYWMADVYDGEPTTWAEIQHGPVLVGGIT